jgi:hypothetical protein
MMHGPTNIKLAWEHFHLERVQIVMKNDATAQPADFHAPLQSVPN